MSYYPISILNNNLRNIYNKLLNLLYIPFSNTIYDNKIEHNILDQTFNDYLVDSDSDSNSDYLDEVFIN